MPRDKAWCFPNAYPDKPSRQWLIHSQQPVSVLLIVLLYRVMPKLQAVFCICFHQSTGYILTWCLGFLVLASVPSVPSVPYAVSIKYRTVLCDMTPFTLVEIWLRFGRMHCLHLHCKVIWKQQSSETPVNFYHATERHFTITAAKSFSIADRLKTVTVDRSLCRVSLWGGARMLYDALKRVLPLRTQVLFHFSWHRCFND